MKNGVFTTTMVTKRTWLSGNWSINYYMGLIAENTMSDFGEFTKLQSVKSMVKNTREIEYSDILDSSRFSIKLDVIDPQTEYSGKVAAPLSILIGSIRPYLGNILIVPKVEWFGFDQDYLFPIKSEFLIFEPNDGLIWYWYWYLNSEDFLGRLPVGSGDTRPRLNPNEARMIPATPVSLESRKKLNATIRDLYNREWELMLEIIEKTGQFKTGANGE